MAVGLAWTKFLGPLLSPQPKVTGKLAALRVPAEPEPQEVVTPAPAATAAAPDKTQVASAAPPAKPVDPRQHGWRGHILHQLDKDADGMLSEAEIPPAFRKPLLAADKDGNGKIDFAEFDAALPMLPLPADVSETSSTALLTPPPAGERVPVYMPKQAKRAMKVPDWFAKRDRDGDGQVGLYEWPANEIERFRKLDRNRDGFLTSDEVAGEK